MQGKELPEYSKGSEGILIFVLLCDMLNTAIREIISLSAQNEEDRQPAALATVILFGLVVVLFFGSLAIINLVYLCYNESDDLPIKIAILVVEIIGSILYFYGDNIGFIFDQYGEILGCGQQCVENNRIAAVITLGLALIFYHLFPPCLIKAAKMFDLEGETTAWYSATDMFTSILKIDSLFTVVAIMAQTDEFCGRTDLSISIAFLVLCFIVGIGLLVTYCSFSSYILKDNRDTETWWWIVPFAFILLSLCFPMYVLADNLQPLDCAFGCDSFAANQTQNAIGCNAVANSALRLGFTLFTFITVSILSLLLFCCRHNTKGDIAVI